MNARKAAVPPHVPPALVVDFDIYHPPGVAEDFHGAWVRFQAEMGRPLVWSPYNGGHWIAVAGQDVFAIHADHERFSNRRNVLPATVRPALGGALMLDPPAHAPYRHFLNTGLSPKVVRQMEPVIRRVARGLVDDLLPKGGCEFIADFADVLPLTVFLTLVDLPLSDRAMLAHLAATNTRDENLSAREDAWRSLRNYMKPVLAARRVAPGDDMISQIATLEVEGKRLSDAEALGACTHLMIAGLDTVSSLLGFVMMYLSRHGAHRRALAADPARIPEACKELIRRFPLVIQAREVRADLELHGVMLKEGDMIAMPSMLYNLDPAVFAEPLALDFERPVPAVCTFGNGVHRCPGAILGRSELAIALAEWLARIPEFEIADGARPAAKGGVVATVQSLTLRWPIGSQDA